MVISVLRKEARNNLKGKWKKAILMMIMFYITTIVLGLINSWISVNTPYRLFSIIVSIVITITLNYGLLGSFIKLKRNEKVNVLHFIYYAGRDGDKVWKNIGRILFRLLFYLLALLLCLYLVITETISLYYGYGVRLSYFVEIICLIGFAILYLINTLYYSLNNYILFDDNKQKSKQILDESKRLMTNHRWDFFKMMICFSGWFILGIIFSVGIILALYFFAKINNYVLLYISYIPLMFLLPYIYITNICFYDNILYNNPKPKDENMSNKKKMKTKNKDKKKNRKK